MSVVELNSGNFEPTVSQEGIVLVDCWAPWCGPCRQFKPVFEKTAEAHADMVFGTLNTETEQGVATALQIMSIPTLMIFRDGILVYREPGALPQEALEDLISQVSALDMEEVRAKVAETEKRINDSESK